MKAADLITWLADRLYLSGQATSKRAATQISTEIVNELIDKGVLKVDDATATVSR